MGLVNLISQGDWRYLRFKAASSTATVMSNRVAYHQAHDQFVPSHNIVKHVLTINKDMYR